MSWFVDCANCGKQVSIDGPASKCYWCGKNATKKESEVMVAQDDRAKFEEMSNFARGKWIEGHREEIVADIRSMSKKAVLKKWPCGQSTIFKLTKLYAPEMIKEPTSKRKKTKDENLPVTKKENPSLTEHERYLILLGYQTAVREFLKADKNHAYGD